MSLFSKAAASKPASEKMVKIHIVIVFLVCVGFGIINAVSEEVGQMEEIVSEFRD